LTFYWRGTATRARPTCCARSRAEESNHQQERLSKDFPTCAQANGWADILNSSLLTPQDCLRRSFVVALTDPGRWTTRS
jgi:hypothetical protein